jgi:hypothetical protein
MNSQSARSRSNLFVAMAELSYGHWFPAQAADGDFVVVWASYGSSGTDTSNYSIQGQRYLPEPDARLGLATCLALLGALARCRARRPGWPCSSGIR